jgi:hypothetical protein
MRSPLIRPPGAPGKQKPSDRELTLFFQGGYTCRSMLDLRDIVGEEWAEWYRLTPFERIEESSRLWETYLALGGSFDPEPDSQSPFYDPHERHAGPADGRTGLRVVRRSGI